MFPLCQDTDGQKEKGIQCDADHSQTGEGSQTDSSGYEVSNNMWSR